VKKLTHYFVLWLLLLLVLTGCFQQAGEAFQPADSTEAPLTLPELTNTPLDPNLTDAQPTATLPDLLVTATPGGIDITVISPTRVLGASATPVASPTTGVEVPTANTQTFRTPISPLGPVTPDTPAPITPAGGTSATPSGLITPTALPGIGGETVSGDCSYTIQRGETLFRIALANDTTVNDIVAANPGINPNLIQPGQVIQLPGCTPGGAPNVTVPTATSAAVVNPPGGGTTYTVERGDTLFAIAQRFGVTVQAIVEANSLSNPNDLSVGQQLIIPPAP